MEVRTRQESGVAVVEIEGDVDLYSSPEVRKEIISLTKSKSPTILVDLGKVNYMDSSGLATLVEGLQLTRSYKGAFKLLGLQDSVFEVFELTRLVEVFEIHDSLELAMRSLVQK